ncbi:transmembrane protease serine 9-like [Ptiloglossa arizonensis]|uniref:transmembrane protease serine 9-like n=1 Tax=Ptiloglossa arizonensis TaxID=3350558 RepID=UPI003FA173FC
MFLATLAFFALLSLCNAGLLPQLDPRIVNGEDAKVGEIPYQVSLQNKGSSFHFCGGSVLNKNYVITAAHCVTGKIGGNIQIVAGTINLAKPTSKHNVKKIIIHELYNSSDSWKNDIALLKVDKEFIKSKQISFVPLPLANQSTPVNQVATVSGWGRLWEGGPTTIHLQRVDILIASQEYCKYMYKSQSLNIYDSQVCAYDPSVQKGSCHGDSGGPLTIKGKLIGLVSWAMGCAYTDYPTVYTRVSSHLDWIKKNAVNMSTRVIYFHTLYTKNDVYTFTVVEFLDEIHVYSSLPLTNQSPTRKSHLQQSLSTLAENIATRTIEFKKFMHNHLYTNRRINSVQTTVMTNSIYNSYPARNRYKGLNNLTKGYSKRCSTRKRVFFINYIVLLIYYTTLMLSYNTVYVCLMCHCWMNGTISGMMNLKHHTTQIKQVDNKSISETVGNFWTVECFITLLTKRDKLRNMGLPLVALFSVLAVTNAAVALSFNPRIINGKAVQPGEIPYQVSIQAKTNKHHFCGGSVLNANYVLTAAHCIDGQDPDAIEVVVGTVNVADRVSVHQVERIIMHKNYSQQDSWKNDIALIKVKPKLTTSEKVSPVSLPEANKAIPTNSAALVSGWGSTRVGGRGTTKLMKARIYIADQNKCKSTYSRIAKKIYDSQICANNPTVKSGACNGDSGGPLTVNGQLVGIVSWSISCALPNFPTVYTRVTSYLDWIEQNAV